MKIRKDLDPTARRMILDIEKRIKQIEKGRKKARQDGRALKALCAAGAVVALGAAAVGLCYWKRVRG